MPAYIPTSNINLLDAWNLIDSTSFLDSEASTVTSTTSSNASASFTPGAITISAIALKLSSRVASPTGTATVELYDTVTLAVVATVTVDVVDLPVNGGWVIFKLGSDYTLSANAHTVRQKSSTASQVTWFRNATSSNVSRALITTTTAVPTTNDQLIIAGNLTGQGTGNDVTVTLNQTGSPVQFGTTALTQSISIAHRGTLQLANSASQSYVMKHRGICQVRGGTLRLGTSGSRLDATSSFVWTADSVASADSGWHFHSGTVDIYGASNKAKWTTLEANVTSGSSKQLTVASTTGFAVGDTVYLTTTNGTTRTQDDYGVLTSIDSATTMTIGSLAFAHTGTNDSNGDRRARVVNCSRNILFLGNSVSLGGYIDHNNTCVVNMSYMAMWYMGSTAATAGKRGFDIRHGVSGSTNIQYCCSFLGGTTNGIQLNLNPGATAASITVQHSTFIRGGTTPIVNNIAGAAGIVIEYCLAAGMVAGNAVNINGANQIVRYCEFIGTQAGGNTGGMNIAGDNTNFLPISGDISNNYVAFCNYAVLYTTGTSSRAYLMDSWTVVECPSGIYLGVNAYFTTKERQQFNNWTITGGGSGAVPVNILGSGIWDFIGCTFALGAGVWTRLVGLATSAANKHDVRFINCTISNGSLIDLVSLNSFVHNGNIRFINCTGMGSVPLMASGQIPYLFEDMIVSSQKHNGTNDLHRSAIKQGTVETDTTIKDTGRTRSCRLTPFSASVKCGSAMVWRVRVTGGTTITPQVRWRKSVVGDGAAYNGNQPRLIIKRNDAVGVSADTVLATGTNAANGAWENQSGTSVTFTDEGEVLLYVDCDGTTGWLNIDSITVGSESNDMTYWNDGLPVQYLSGGGSVASQRNNPFLCQAVG